MGSRIPLRALTLAVAPFGLGLATLFAVGNLPGLDAAAAASLVPVVAGLSTLTALGVFLLPRLVARSRSLPRSIFVVAMSAMVVTGLAVTLSNAMLMIPAPSVAPLALVFIYGAALGVIVELAVARSLSADIRRLAVSARRIRDGDYSTRVALDREDELGQTADIVDRMATELQEMEDERRDAQAARQAFLAGVGHDLRTPLAAMRAAVEAVEDGLVPDPSRYYAAMHHDLDALTSMVDDLFLLARLEGGVLTFQRAALDLAELADEAVEALLPVARERGVSLRSATSGHVFALGGPAELSRAMRNLIDNAIRYGPAGSEVIVEVWEAGGPRVRVVDAGPGFGEAVQRQLVDAGDRATPMHGRGVDGTGLGLLIAKRLVEAHGGRLLIESGPGGRITFELPAVASAQQARPSTVP